MVRALPTVRYNPENDRRWAMLVFSSRTERVSNGRCEVIRGCLSESFSHSVVLGHPCPDGVLMPVEMSY